MPSVILSFVQILLQLLKINLYVSYIWFCYISVMVTLEACKSLILMKINELCALPVYVNGCRSICNCLEYKMKVVTILFMLIVCTSVDGIVV
jgi:hypothetical protein